MSTRALVAAALFLSLLAMCVHYGDVAQERDPYPTSEALQSDYADHVGAPFYAWGTVVSAGPEGIVVSARGVTLTVPEPVPGADPGDSIQVAGTLAADHRLVAERIVLSDETNLLALYVVSALGALLAVAFFRRHWTVDRSGWCLVPRDRDGAHR